MKSRYSFFLTVLLLLAAIPVQAHNLPVGGSKWCLGSNGVIANIDLNQNLFADIKGIKEGHYDLAAVTEKQLQQISTDIIQPYINSRLSISVNGKTYPVKVTRLTRTENNLYTIWLLADKVNFNKPENPVKIDYRLLFEETNNAHLNLAYMYRSDATGDALQKIFDFSQSDGQFNFENNSPVWELSVKGPATAEPVASPNKSASLPAIKPVASKVQLSSAAQRTVSPVLQEIPDTSNVAIQVHARQHTPPANSEALQNKQATDSKSDNSPNVPMVKDVSESREQGNSTSQWSNIGRFVLLGIEHILTGYDHIAFLIGLIVIGLTTREVLKIITAFTIAHSITLLLAALQIISLNSAFVESVIALSICYIALENLFRKEVKYRWLITFCFGLIHGFGFASALQELIVGKTNLVLSVVSFNFGVETGQLMIFFVLLPVLHVLKQRMNFRRVTSGVSLAILILGFTWLLERLFDLKLISS
jgi:hydrogenase/urease accessory protein HupE